MPDQTDEATSVEATFEPDLERKALASWSRLSDFANEWFYEPDLEVLEIALSVGMAHYFRADKPIWLMILGSPGSGKTALTLTCLEALPYATTQDDLSSSTFLSGLAMGKENQFSLLHNIGTESDRSGILLFPDFTTFMTKHSEERDAILGQLRRIYDGKFDRRLGNGALEWEGKVTIIAAATPEVERNYTMQRNMGERFMQVRWPRGDGIKQASKAIQQIEHENFIRKELMRLTKDFIFPGGAAPKPLPMFKDFESVGAVHLAELVARLRVHVPRERDGRREIADVPPEAEAPTRIIKAMGQLTRARATAFHRPEVGPPDFKVARRIALDSIPPLRRRIFEICLKAQDGEIGQVELLKQVGAPRTTTLRGAEDLEAIGALTSVETIERKWLVSDQFREYTRLASPILGL